MKPKSVTYILSEIDKALAFEWVAQYLDRSRFKLNFILLNDSESNIERFIIQQGLPVRRISLNKRWKMIPTFIAVWWLLLTKRPNIVHTHLRYASILGITAGYFSFIKMRIHTRHSAAFNAYYHPHAVKIDKWVSRLSSHIVSISDIVTSILVEWESTDPKKIAKIPHGFDLDYFKCVQPSRVQKLRSYYLPELKGPIIGMISRYMDLKGIQYTIDGFQEVLSWSPNAHLVLANASGPDSADIKQSLSKLPSGSFTEIAFEQDVAALYRLFDVFIHVPIDAHSEAFGQTYVEALASGIPSIFTKAGIACEFIQDHHNALVVDYKNSSQIAAAIKKILSDKELQEKLTQNGLKSVEQFNLKLFIEKLEALYDQ